MVKAARTLHGVHRDSANQKGSMVTLQKGSIGTLRSLEDKKSYTISWCGRDELGLTSFPKAQLLKCEPLDFLTTGDTIKAVTTITYTSLGQSITEGSLGTLVSLDDAKKNLWTVAWSDPFIAKKANQIDLAVRRSLGSVQAYSAQFRKCTSGEFFQVGDIVKAAKKLTYAGGVVQKGSIGTLKSL
jgi:hypothetical protein